MKDILSREETCKEIYLLISNVIADLSRKFEADQISHQTFRESADKYFRLSVSASMHLQYGVDAVPDIDPQAYKRDMIQSDNILSGAAQMTKDEQVKYFERINQAGRAAQMTKDEQVKYFERINQAALNRIGGIYEHQRDSEADGYT